MGALFAWSVPKEVSAPLENEDCFRIDEGLGRYVVCDGASESFDSRTWASLLADRFLSDPVIDHAWLKGAISDYESRYDSKNLSWSKQAAYERGSFSTLLGAIPREEGGYNLIVVGDSLAVMIEDESIVHSIPYGSAADFKDHPILLSTSRLHNQNLLDENGRLDGHVLWPNGMTAKSQLLLMTDALGEWILRLNANGDPQWKVLLDLHSTEAFTELVLAQRAAHAMRNDDTTLLVIRA